MNRLLSNGMPIAANAAFLLHHLKSFPNNYVFVFSFTFTLCRHSDVRRVASKQRRSDSAETSQKRRRKWKQSDTRCQRQRNPGESDSFRVGVSNSFDRLCAVLQREKFRCKLIARAGPKSNKRIKSEVREEKKTSHPSAEKTPEDFRKIKS